MNYKQSHPIAWQQGLQARERGEPRSANQYPEDSSSHDAWNEGWDTRDFYESEE